MEERIILASKTLNNLSWIHEFEAKLNSMLISNSKSKPKPKSNFNKNKNPMQKKTEKN